MHHVLHPRSYSWLTLAFLALAGCPASPPDVSLRGDAGEPMPPDARVVDAAGPSTDAPGPQGDGGGAPDARPADGGVPGGTVREYGWPPSSAFTNDLDYPEDLVILQRVTVLNDGDVAYLGTIVRGLAGSAAKVGLYREVAGLPTDLVATTDVFTTVVGVNQHPPLQSVALTAGNYWSAVVLSAPTSLATNASGSSPLRTANVGFLSALPATLSSSTQSTAPDINVYVGILEP